MAKFRFDTSLLEEGIFSFEKKVARAVRLRVATGAKALEAAMKKNRRWTDRTGAAKTRLAAAVSEPSDDVVRITLSHGVEYGVWLELGREKNYAIIKPTLDREGAHFIEQLQNMLERLTDG